MGLMDYLKGQFLEIIQWTDDSRDTLSWRFPDEDKEIKRGAQLIVRESQIAQFVYLGEYGDTFGPGKHTLSTENIPILSTLKGWKYGFESPFKADVYYVTTRLFTGNKWGTSNPIMMRDADFGIVRVRAFGTFDFRITEPKLFLKEVAGTDNHFRLDEFADTMRSRIVSVFTDALATAKVPVLDLATRYSELGEALLPIINPTTQGKYGIEITSFILENASVPPEVEAAIDKRSSMGAIGNLNDYVKFQ
ncbi:SPFH domain-containing protein, partial [Prosthecobacter sp.]|uniref:SPFH domain-containing protein n=1 Tax=Prosthecobacter sp. TaxID=1965333 RepID=UPI0037CB3808